MKPIDNEKPWYERMTEGEYRDEKRRDCKSCVIAIIIGTLIFIAAYIFSSCEGNAPDPILKPAVEVYPSNIDTTLFGKYESNRGEKNPGSIYIEKDNIYVNTIMTEMNLKIENVEYSPDCFIIFTLEDGVKVKLSLFRSINRITLWFIYPDDSTEYLGTFNKVI